MKSLMKKIFAPLAVFALAIGVSVSANNLSEIVGVRAVPQLLNSFYFLDGGSSSNNTYTGINLATNVNYASDNPGGDVGTTPWEADYANLSLTSGTRLGGKLISTVQTDDTSPWANIKTKFTFGSLIEQVQLMGVTTFGTAGNVTMLYLQSSLDSLTWATVASTTTKSGDITFSGLSIPESSYLRFGIDLTASGTNSGIVFTGIKVYQTATEVIPVLGVSLDKTTSSLWVGDTEQLTANVTPSGATDKSVTWQSLNGSIATVNSTGLVTAIAAGQTTIRVTTNDGGFYADCVYTISTVSVTGVTLNQNSIELLEGQSFQLVATVSPINATNKSVSWSSSDETKVAVSDSGLLTAISKTTTPVIVAVTTLDGNLSDNISVVVNEDLFNLISSSTFDASGSANWPISIGMGAYYTTGYGVTTASAGATIKSPFLLEDVTVGSQIRVEIASVTNSTTNTTDVSIYGLDYNGERIPGVTGTYTNPTNGGGTVNLTSLTDRALENKGILVLPITLITKIYGLEIVFETASSRTLLAQVDVFSLSASDSDQATAFVNLVNTDVGLGANGSCSSILEVLQNDYLLLSSGAKTIVDTSSDNAFVSARERLSYLESWVAQNPSANPTREAVNNSSNKNLVAVVSIGFIGLTSILGYYFINKKNSLG